MVQLGGKELEKGLKFGWFFFFGGEEEVSLFFIPDSTRKGGCPCLHSPAAGVEEQERRNTHIVYNIQHATQ